MHQPLELPSAVSTATNGPHPDKNVQEGGAPSETVATAQPDPPHLPVTTVPALATEPRILDRLVMELRNSGVVGEARAAKLIYLLVTSRVLERPISAVLKGPSSAGKNHNVESILRLFPPPATMPSLPCRNGRLPIHWNPSSTESLSSMRQQDCGVILAVI